jgi:hypothetical protein
MLGLILLAVAGAWIGLGYLILDRVLKPMFMKTSRFVRIPTFIVLTIAWLVGPWIDEPLAGRAFAIACDQMPHLRFHGPLALGAGAYFDEHGNRKWKTSDEFFAIKRSTKDWDNAFGLRQERTRVQDWPAPVVQVHSTYYSKKTDLPVVEAFHRISPGGWLKRTTGWGSHAPYQCARKGHFPSDEEMVSFN